MNEEIISKEKVLSLASISNGDVKRVEEIWASKGSFCVPTCSNI